MLEIPIMIGKEEYFITNDSRNYMISKKRDKKNSETRKIEEAWSHEGFYGTISGLFSDLFEMKVRASDAKSMAELHEEMAKMKRELIYCVENHKEELYSVTLNTKD